MAEKMSAEDKVNGDFTDADKRDPSKSPDLTDADKRDPSKSPDLTTANKRDPSKSPDLIDAGKRDSSKSPDLTDTDKRDPSKSPDLTDADKGIPPKSSNLIDADKGDAPKIPRKPRINRRGFSLSGHSSKDLTSDTEQKASINGCEDDPKNKIKTDSSQKRIISLVSIKNDTSEKSSSTKARESSTIISLKKSFSPIVNKNENLEISSSSSSSADPPPKKKHKPITWP